MPVNKYEEFMPHADLQNSVKRFWMLEKEYTEDDSTEEVTPDACIELIFNFGAPYVQDAGPTRRELANVCLVGLLSKPLRLQARGVVKLVAVRFYAWGAFTFFKDAAGLNSAAGVDLDPMWRQTVEKAGEYVRADDYQKAVEQVEDFLLGLHLNTLFDPQQVRTAAKFLYQTKGQFRVAELADYCHLSVRQLQRQFDQATGVSPKTLARTIRFEAIRERLMFDPNANLTDLAYEFGYTDQAHFIKDFKAFTDKTPSEFVDEMRGFQEMFRNSENVVFLQSLPTMPDYDAHSQEYKGGR